MLSQAQIMKKTQMTNRFISGCITRTEEVHRQINDWMVSRSLPRPALFSSVLPVSSPNLHLLQLCVFCLYVRVFIGCLWSHSFIDYKRADERLRYTHCIQLWYQKVNESITWCDPHFSTVKLQNWRNIHKSTTIRQYGLITVIWLALIS